MEIFRKHSHQRFQTLLFQIILTVTIVLIPALVFASIFDSDDISGYVKNLNFFTSTSGFTPELVDRPNALAEKGEHLFDSLNRLRLLCLCQASQRSIEKKPMIADNKIA